MYFYLQELKTELHQIAESNKNNLQDMIILKQAYLRLDNIINSIRNSRTKAKRTGIQDTTLSSSTKNNEKGKDTGNNKNKNYKSSSKLKSLAYKFCSKKEHSS